MCATTTSPIPAQAQNTSFHPLLLINALPSLSPTPVPLGANRTFSASALKGLNTITVLLDQDKGPPSLPVSQSDAPDETCPSLNLTF